MRTMARLPTSRIHLRSERNYDLSRYEAILQYQPYVHTWHADTFHESFRRSLITLLLKPRVPMAFPLYIHSNYLIAWEKGEVVATGAEEISFSSHALEQRLFFLNLDTSFRVDKIYTLFSNMTSLTNIVVLNCHVFRFRYLTRLPSSVRSLTLRFMDPDNEVTEYTPDCDEWRHLTHSLPHLRELGFLNFPTLWYGHWWDSLTPLTQLTSLRVSRVVSCLRTHPTTSDTTTTTTTSSASTPSTVASWTDDNIISTSRWPSLHHLTVHLSKPQEPPYQMVTQRD